MRQIMNERISLSKSSPLKARFYDYNRFSYPWHFHPEYEIIYVKESTGTRFVGNSIEKYAAGDIILIGSNLPHYMKSDDIYFSDNEELRVKGTIIQFEKDFMYHSIKHYPHFIKIKRLLEDAQRGLYFPAGCSSKLTDLLDIIPLQDGIDGMIAFLTLLKEMSEVNTASVISSSDFVNDITYDTSRIEKIISYLNKHYIRPISLEEIASFAAMNPTAFCRFFKSKTGKSFKNYLLDMRIGYACQLLLPDDINIAQISVRCGFDTISHFNKTFKRKTGI